MSVGPTATSPDPALLDIAKLEAWLVRNDLAAADPSGKVAGGISADTLTGGRSNVMFTIQVGADVAGADGDSTSHNWVLRRPATVAIERANDGMRREFTILSALDSTPVPHPRTVAMCEDLDVLGCVFYLMEKVDGLAPAGQLPETFTSRPGHRQELTAALLDALAALHNVDWRQVGLANFGRPDGFHERQVSRWSKQLSGYQGRDIPELAEAGDWLQQNIPQRWSPAIMHGDYHMFNVLIEPDPPARVAAIVDWETATIGDPWLDFVGFCEAWQSMRTGGGEGGGEGEGEGGGEDGGADSWPSYGEMLEYYTSQRQPSQDQPSQDQPNQHQLPSDQEQQYYGVLYNFRMAVLLEGIYQRSLHDPNRPDQDMIGDRALFNAARCQQILADVSCLQM